MLRVEPLAVQLVPATQSTQSSPSAKKSGGQMHCSRLVDARSSVIATPGHDAQLVALICPGKLLYVSPLGEEGAQRWGAPLYNIHRADLIEILADALPSGHEGVTVDRTHKSAWQEVEAAVHVGRRGGRHRAVEAAVARVRECRVEPREEPSVP